MGPIINFVIVFFLLKTLSYSAQFLFFLIPIRSFPLLTSSGHFPLLLFLSPVSAISLSLVHIIGNPLLHPIFHLISNTLARQLALACITKQETSPPPRTNLSSFRMELETNGPHFDILQTKM